MPITVRSISSRCALAIARYAVIALVAGACSGVTPAAAAEDPYPLACAKNDLDAITLIDLQAYSDRVSHVKLAEAYRTVITARRLCAEGRVEEGLAAYRTLIIPRDAEDDDED